LACTIQDQTSLALLDQLKQHLHTFLMAYNFAKRLKTLRGLCHTNLSVGSGGLSRSVFLSIQPIIPWD